MRFMVALCSALLFIGCTMAPAFAAEPTVVELLDVLHNKGVIDDATYNDLKSKAQAEAARPAVAPAPAVSSDRPLDKGLTNLEEGFARLSGDTVKLKIGTWLQGGYAWDDRKSDAATNSGISIPLAESSAVNTNSSNSFYLRFARLYFNGTLSDKMGFRIMFDAAASTSILRDAYVWLDYIPYTRVTIGQFPVPIGGDSWRGPFDLPMIEYTLNTTAFQPTAFRDIGVLVSPKYVAKLPIGDFGVSLATAAVNGNGPNTTDDNDSKDWYGRLAITPIVPGLEVAGSWQLGRTSTGAGQRDWQRWAADLNFAPKMVPGLLFRGEYMSQRKFFTGPARYVHSNGWNATLAMRMDKLVAVPILKNLEPVARYEELNGDKDIHSDERRRTTLGMNYWLNKYSRLMVNYEWYDVESDVNGTAGALTVLPNGSRDDHGVLKTNVQVFF